MNGAERSLKSAAFLLRKTGKLIPDPIYIEFHKSWSDVLHNDKWGRTVRVMIHLRTQLGREPTDDEIEEAQGLSDEYKHISAEEIKNAFDQGEQVCGGCSMYEQSPSTQAH